MPGLLNKIFRTVWDNFGAPKTPNCFIQLFHGHLDFGTVSARGVEKFCSVSGCNC